MTRPTDETLLAFLEGTLDETARRDLLDRLDADPALAADLRRAAAGLAAVETIDEVPVAPSPSASSEAAASAGRAEPGVRGPRRISPWWAVAASLATLFISVPATMRFTVTEPGGPDSANLAGAAPSAVTPSGRPASSDPSYVLVLHGRWPDAGAVDDPETSRRADEYWNWTSSLADRGILVAAGDLRWEPGERLAPAGVEVAVDGRTVEGPDFVVGMLALRVDSYEAALAIARACPHLRYGGSVSVRRVGAGFVTVPGMSDWKG